MGTWSLIVVLLISRTASLEKKCPSNILKKFLSDSSKVKEHYQNGETISVTCLADSGDFEYDYANYDDNAGSDTKDNSVVLICTEGKWIGRYPECFTNCSKPDIYAILDPEYDLYAPGDNVTIMACKKDNARIEGDTTLICMADGTWIGSARCPKQQRSCSEQPPTITNAYITAVVLDEYRHGTVLRYKCGQAFDQMGIHSVTCHDGRWIPDSSSLMRCIIGQCSPIYSREIDNGRVKNVAGEVGTYAEFECYDGYELDGSARILCMADRKWHPEIPKCKPVSCPSPKQPIHGRLVQEAYNGVLNIYQSTIRYDCDKGYRIVGPQFRKCQADRTWSGSDTKCEEILCDKPTPPENGKVYLTDNSEKVGSQIEYICDEHHIMEPITSQFAICTEHGHWSRPNPRCIKTCKVRALSQGSIRTIVRLGRKINEDTYVPDNTELIFTCDKGYEKYAGGYETDGRLNCLNGALFPGPPECRPQRCNIRKIENGHFRQSGIVIVAGEKIQSGNNIRLVCADKYELYNERTYMYLELEETDIKCYQGSFTAEIPSCKPRRCLIDTEADLEYLIDGKRVLDRYIHNGTLMQARCPDRMELVRSIEYLDREQEYVKCNMGTLEPGTLVCKDKRCNVTEIENGHFRQSGIVIVAGKKIQSGSNIRLICSDGYELYKEPNSPYLELEHTEINCYQGSFTAEIPSCKPKACSEPAFQYIIVENGTLANEDRIFSHGTKLNASCDSSSTLHGGKSRGGNGTSAITECSHGEWKPKFSCKKTCTLPTGTFKFANLKQQNITRKEGDRIKDGRKMVPVCPSGHKEVKHSTCSNGTWVPSFEECAEGIGRCSIPNVPGMQFTYIRNGTVVADGHLEKGDNVVVSCRSGYEIDTPSGSENGYDYDYSDAQSTAYPVVVPKAKDSEKLRPISNGTYTCRETGKWEPEIRFACKLSEIICHRLDDFEFENGRITYSSPDIHNVGTVASFTCHPGYTRDGPANRTCQEDGTWSGTCVTCQSDKRNSSTMCPAPCVPDWAKKTGSHTYDLGSRVEFQCLPSETQYSGDSSNVRHCVNGNKSPSWTGTLINCKGLRDVSLRMIAEGVADGWGNLSRALGIQSNQVGVTADEPSSNALKTLQYWRDIVMRDKPKSLIPDLIIVMETLQKRDVAVGLRSLNGLQNIRCKHPSLNGTVKPDQSDYLFGQSVRVSSCDDGYMLLNQSYLVCSENGTWFGNSTCRHAICSPECGINGKCVGDNECRCSEGFSGKTCDEKVECEPLDDDYTVIQPGVVHGKFSHQTVVEISCNKSQAPFNDVKHAECDKSIWRPKKPSCQNTCLLQPIPGTLYNYNISRDKVVPGPVSSGRRIKVTCEKGFISVPQVSDVSMCMNGVWNPDILRCEKEVSCATPSILNVIVVPLKETYAVNEYISLIRCLKGLHLKGARSLLCLKDGSWYGHAQCTSYCQNGQIYWDSTSYRTGPNTATNVISYTTYTKDSMCYDSCAKNQRCKALYIYKYSSENYYCKLFTENTRNMPQAFTTDGGRSEQIYDKACNDACVVSKDLHKISLLNGDSPYHFEQVQDGMVLTIKCKDPGLTAVPGHVTCMGGKWSHPIEEISCLSKGANV